MKMEILGKNIRQLRYQKGWSLRDVAIHLAISIPAVSKIENGVTDINMSRLEQIAAVFGMSAVGLLSYADDERYSLANKELLDTTDNLKSRQAEIIELQRTVIQMLEKLKSLK
jgi:transcriptional regulator with XRE-family HTH domain